MDQLPLFVYGSLRQHEPNHGYLAGRFDRCLPATLHGFRRDSAPHGFPVIRPAAGEQVPGELYFLSDAGHSETLRGCDALEEIPEGQLDGPLYNRRSVVVATAEGPFTAWAYVGAAAAPDAPA